MSPTPGARDRPPVDGGPKVAALGGGPRVVALGGGHGLAASLQALRLITSQVTAVVTVADDGGSSGRLRAELGCLPPGDLRMALAALASPDGDEHTLERLLQHRFGGDGPLAGHAVGNLLIVALAQVTGDVVQALAVAARMVGAAGQVLPASRVPLEIVAQVAGLDPGDLLRQREIVGQVAVASTGGEMHTVSLRPEDPPACAEAVEAIERADCIVLGPGSWFTSVLPHLLVPGLAAALQSTRARRVVALNLAPQEGETAGFSPQAHLEVLREHAPGLRLDAVVADRNAVVDTRGLMAAASSLGARLVLADVALGDGTPRHDPQRLAAAYREVLTGWVAPPTNDDEGTPRWR